MKIFQLGQSHPTGVEFQETTWSKARLPSTAKEIAGYSLLNLCWVSLHSEPAKSQPEEFVKILD